MRFSAIAVFSVLTACSWVADDSENYHWEAVSDSKHEDERTQQDRMEHDLSQCVSQAHGFNVEMEECMVGRGYQKHPD